MVKNKTEILGVKIDPCTMQEVLAHLTIQINNKKQTFVVTPNPEMLLIAKKDEEFKKIMNGADLAIPDGIGLVWASRFVGKMKISERVTGTDLMQKLCEKAPQHGWKIFLLGAQAGVAEQAAKILQTKYPGLEITGCYAGSPLPAEDDYISKKIALSGANILFVAYGAPVQEKWIARNRKKMPDITCAIGIGGAFDFIAGIRKRAPLWMQKTGLEWLWRVIQEPKRIKRIWNATIVFPWKVIQKK